MAEQRILQHITFAEHPDQGRKAWINLAGCNFNCKGCFALAKTEAKGIPLTVENLVSLLTRCSKHIWGKMVNRVVLTGGEPTLNPTYLINLIYKLKELSVKYFELSTNGYLCDESLLEQLKSIKRNLLVKLDIKAYSNEVHKWYTGKENTKVLNAARLLHKKKFNFLIRTVFIPGFVDLDEIERLAKFINSIDKNICFRIQQFAPPYGSEFSRRPSEQEMLNAYGVSRKYLNRILLYTLVSNFTRPEYNYIEVRAEELTEEFKKIDEVSELTVPSWSVNSLSLNQFLDV